MTVESASYVKGLNAALPAALDPKSEGDNHIRLLKTILQATFPNLNGAAFRVAAKSANYTVTLDDNLLVLDCTATLTISLPVAASAGNGFAVTVLANGAEITIDPNGAELVNGLTTLQIASGDAVTIYCTGTAWKATNVAAGAKGASGDKVFWENDQTVTADYTITAGKNAMTAGPITIASGVTITVPAGSTWTVV